MPKPDLYLLAALVVGGVLDPDVAKIVERVYGQNEYIAPIDLDTAVGVVLRILQDEAETEAEEMGGHALGGCAACTATEDEAAEYDASDSLSPPGWWIVAHESWHRLMTGEPDCS